KEVKRRIMLGTFVLSTGYYDAYFAKAQQVRRLLAHEIEEITANFDGILSPTSPTPAFPVGIIKKDPTEVYLADIFTVLANLTGIPAISLPLFSHSYSIPFGLQIMCGKREELSLLGISAFFLNRRKADSKE
ncbi:MAG: amidase family protein, partial [Ferruginibacter sp.]